MRCAALLCTLLTCLFGCEGSEAVFTRLDAARTGVTFTNTTGESDSFNILTNEYIYNGGGVGVGDFNADGRPDLFFSGSNSANALYLNEGDFRFRNVTAAAGVGGGDRWNNGVAVVDVNGDGRDDVYVCATLRGNRANQLFLNQGNDADGTPIFTDVAPAYGIADTTHNTQSAWLDYDGDGDLDLFLLVNEMVATKAPNSFSRKVQDGSGRRTDKLYRQDRDGDRIYFTEVGREAGVLLQGFGLGATVCDLNGDGWPDLYVTNDYLSNDLAYLNVAGPDGRRRFRDVSYQLVKHTSYSAMGNDVADLNNDGLPDILAVDMLPADNLRRKMMLGANNYSYYLNLRRYGYHPQFTRNTLQLSHGLRTAEGDSLAGLMSGLPVYDDVAMQAGLPATDWSWTPLVADFDLDGLKDVIVTNGFPRDITDHDFGDYNAANSRFFAMKEMLPKIPSVKIPNVAFRAVRIDDGVPYYADVSAAWGIDVTSFSNGAAFADLDGDGDLDYVVNNIDDPAHLYRNNTVADGAAVPSLTIRAAPGLTDAEFWGSAVTVTHGDSAQYFYWHPHRGYLSSHGQDLTVAAAAGAEVTVRFPGGRARTYVADGPVLTVSPTTGMAAGPLPAVAQAGVLQRLPAPDFVHEERDFVDFNVQPMLLRKVSQQGPGLAVTDFDGDGLDDLYVSGSFERAGSFLRGTGGGFVPAPNRIEGEVDDAREELGSLFFDADGDGDDDLYVVCGSYELPLDQGDYRDRFYRNDGGRFVAQPAVTAAHPVASGATVRAADVDADGDLDLFVGNRVVPHAYPTPVTSYLLINETDGTDIRFTKTDLPVLADVTNVVDALFTDFDADGRPDLLIAGEWSPLRLFRNAAGGWEDATAVLGADNAAGWWNSLTAGDFDNDGDTDYVAGNFGHNTLLRPSQTEPVTAALTDFDDNGTPDFIPFSYLTDEAGLRRSFPFFGRTDFAKQVTKIKAVHTSHQSFARADQDSYATELAAGQTFRATGFSSVYLERTATGFTVRPLPARAQSFPVFGLQALDVNDDAYLDLVLTGNDLGNEVGQGFMDGGNGLVLLGDGAGNFRSLSPAAAGWLVPGEGRALVVARGADGPLLVAAQNRGRLVVARPRVPLVAARAPGADGGNALGRRTERYYGAGYLSQSGRTTWLPAAATTR